MGSISLFIFQKLIYLFSVSLHFLQLFGMFSTYFSRFEHVESDKKVAEDCIEEEEPEIFLRFKFPTFEEFSRNNKEMGNLFCFEEDENGGSSQSAETSVNEVCVEDEAKDDSIRVVRDEDGNVQAAKAEETIQDFLSESQFQSDEISLFTDSNPDSDWETTSFEHRHSVVSSGFLSDGDFAGENQEKRQLENESLSENDFRQEEDKTELISDNLELLWEHQDLIEQLKMELRKVKETGLPTIFEESEPAKIGDLKPWKMDEKLEHEDCLDELHEFSRRYRVRMRKLDILNYQKMYATGFLQSKDPLKSFLKEKKSSIPILKSLITQNLGYFSKHQSHANDPANKFIKELESDLEVIYVGQMCLSWEFLHLQYMKALRLCDSDPSGSTRRYNEVAGEFQHFQILLQRYIEDEPFQGPRVQNYSKNRCVCCNILQVPVIREDRVKNKCKARKEEYGVTSEKLAEIVGESIRLFWQFVVMDKDCTMESTPDLQNPQDMELFIQIRKFLQKKERKVNNIIRSGRSILRKFKQIQDDDSDQILYYFALLDVKIVSRVLNMSKITRDQIMWCHSKLDKISFVDKKIYIEPSFLLFPC